MIETNDSLPDFSKYYQSVLTEELFCRGIVHSVFTDFENISSAEDKVRFILKLNQQFGLLPTESMVVSKKDEIKAAAARKEGNQFFAKGDYLQALENYNKSLCLSDKGSENMGLAYANRSAVYFKTGYYELCLENIELALGNGYPEKMKAKLSKREEDCLTAINNGQSKQMEPEEVDVKLSYKSNPKIPQIVEGIELAKNEKYGNHYVAKKNFSPGDVLMIEKRLVEYLELKKVYMYCSFCLKSNLLNLLPCEESTYAMFCSKSCYNEAMGKFFKYEGPILDAIYKFLQASRAVIRLAIKLISVFGNLDELKEAFDRLTLNNFDPYTFDFKSATEKDLLLAVCSFPTNEHKRYTRSLLIRTDWCANAFYLVKNYTGVGELIQTKDHEDTLMKILYQLNLMEQVYGYSIASVASGSNFVQVKGSELSIVTSFLNHSCAPNVCRLGENMNVVSAIRPIKAGEQLFMSYRSNHNEMPREERRMHLKSNYFFDCACDACEENYTQLRKVNDINLSNEMQKIWNDRPFVGRCDLTNKKIMKRIFDWSSSILRKYANDYPKEEILFRIIEDLTNCMFMLYSNKPLHLAFN